MKTLKSLVNGIVGDYLHVSHNELAVNMNFYHNGKPYNSQDLKQQILDYQTKNPTILCIFVHGSSDDESAWTSPPSSSSPSSSNTTEEEEEVSCEYGPCLFRDLKIVPLYLRYNTGLHISTNGQTLNRLMDYYFGSPPKTQHQDDNNNNNKSSFKLIFICHSMGGLVVRSALHYNNVSTSTGTSTSTTCSKNNSNSATANDDNDDNDEYNNDSPSPAPPNSTWSRHVSQVIFLGTPHHGSHWEQLGNVASTAIGAIPRPYMKLAATVANLRSAGIQDLRYGYILDEDWNTTTTTTNTTTTNSTTTKGPFANNRQQPAILPDWIKYHVVHGTITNNPNHVVSQAIGDGLVRKPSAQGRSEQEQHDLKQLPPSVEFTGTSHSKLSHSPAVYRQIKEWLQVEVEVDEKEQPREQVEEEEKKEHPKSTECTNLMNTNTAWTCNNIDDDTCYSNHNHEPTTSTTTLLNDSFLNDKARSVWEERRGVATLAQDGVCHGVQAVGQVHLAVSDEVFDIISFVAKPIAPVVKTIQTVHNASVSTIYGIVHAACYGSAEVAKCVCTTMDEETKFAEEPLF